MPGPVRKVLIFATVDGLVLQPLAQKGQRPAPPAKIAYKDNAVGPALKDETRAGGNGKSFEAFGVVGKLSGDVACNCHQHRQAYSALILLRLLNLYHPEPTISFDRPN
jgi:hypothetical protein